MDQIDKLACREDDTLISSINYITIQKFFNLLRGTSAVRWTRSHD